MSSTGRVGIVLKNKKTADEPPITGMLASKADKKKYCDRHNTEADRIADELYQNTQDLFLRIPPHEFVPLSCKIKAVMPPDNELIVNGFYLIRNGSTFDLFYIGQDKVKTQVPIANIAGLQAELDKVTTHMTNKGLTLETLQSPSDTFLMPIRKLDEHYRKNIRINIAAMTNAMNTLPYYVLEDILTRKSQHEKTAVMERWIMVMDRSFKMGNMSCVVAIYQGLKNPILAKLNILAGLSAEAKACLEQFGSITDGKAQNARGLAQPKIPYIGDVLALLALAKEGEGVIGKKIKDVQNEIVTKQANLRMENNVHLDSNSEISQGIQRTVTSIGDDDVSQRIHQDFVAPYKNIKAHKASDRIIELKNLWAPQLIQERSNEINVILAQTAAVRATEHAENAAEAVTKAIEEASKISSSQQAAAQSQVRQAMQAADEASLAEEEARVAKESAISAKKSRNSQGIVDARTKAEAACELAGAKKKKASDALSAVQGLAKVHEKKETIVALAEDSESELGGLGDDDEDPESDLDLSLDDEDEEEEEKDEALAKLNQDSAEALMHVRHAMQKYVAAAADRFTYDKSARKILKTIGVYEKAERNPTRTVNDSQVLPPEAKYASVDRIEKNLRKTINSMRRYVERREEVAVPRDVLRQVNDGTATQNKGQRLAASQFAVNYVLQTAERPIHHIENAACYQEKISAKGKYQITATKLPPSADRRMLFTDILTRHGVDLDTFLKDRKIYSCMNTHDFKAFVTARNGNVPNDVLATELRNCFISNCMQVVPGVGSEAIPSNDYLLFADRQIQSFLGEVGSHKTIKIKPGLDPMLVLSYKILCDAKGLKYNDQSSFFPGYVTKPEFLQYIRDNTGKNKLFTPVVDVDIKKEMDALRVLATPQSAGIVQVLSKIDTGESLKEADLQQVKQLLVDAAVSARHVATAKK